VTGERTTLKYVRVAAIVRVQIEADMLPAGALVPSGAALTRLTGFSTLNCRHALRTLIKDGVLVPGVGPCARPRVAPHDPTRRPTIGNGSPPYAPCPPRLLVGVAPLA
jgi:DNA-binding FadR family transcriptional regulator